MRDHATRCHEMLESENTSSFDWFVDEFTAALGLIEQRSLTSMISQQFDTLGHVDPANGGAAISFSQKTPPRQESPS